MFDVWKNVMEEIKQGISPSAFATWFQDVHLVSVEDGIVTIKAPNVFKVGQIKTKYDQLIREALKKNEVDFENIDYIVSSEKKVRPRSREITLSSITNRGSAKKNTKKETSTQFNSNLNATYTMENFVVCSNNDLAASVAKAVIDEPGTKYNPFYLYGSPGLGKTHLVQAIGNELLKKKPNLKVMYVPINHFYSEFVSMIKSGKGSEFAAKYEKLDVLIIDDIQMIAGKERSQDAFFDIFNDLYQMGHQIIITSDRLPEQIKELDVRLSSRLASAGAYDMQLPTFEDRCAILKAKAEYDEVDIEDEAIEYIANAAKMNVRDLEREYKRIITYAELKGVSPLEVINDGYSNTANTSGVAPVSAKKIVSCVAKANDLSVEEMCGKSRVAHIKNARQVAMYLLSEELGMSTTKIAPEVGVKDHTTVMHGIRKVKEDLAANFALRDQVTAIREEIYA